MQAMLRWQKDEAQWSALDEAERDDKLAWELYCQDEADERQQARMKLLREFREQMSSKELLNPEAAAALFIAGLDG